MDNQIFEEQVRKCHQTFRMEGRKIAPFINSCPAHPSVSDLKNVQLVFLLPNTTCFTTNGSMCNQNPKSAVTGESHTSAMQSIR